MTGLRASRDEFRPTSWADCVRLAYAKSPEPSSELPIRDVAGDFRVISRDGRPHVLKRRLHIGAQRECRHAKLARQRLDELPVPGVGQLHVVVPEQVRLGGHTVLVTPHLGESLDRSPSATRALFPVSTLLDVLRVLLDRGIEFSGFVPRNVFQVHDGIAVIDWEDAQFTDSAAVPSLVTTMKWDIAWSDTYRYDPHLRDHFPRPEPVDAPPWDDFERTLAEIAGAGRPAADIRPLGVHITLSSELYCEWSRLSPAELGHLAADVLPPHLELLHTAITALVRDRAGERAFADVIDRVAADVEAGPARWIRRLVEEASRALSVDEGEPPIVMAARRLDALRGWTGWDAAIDRAEAACVVLSTVATLAMEAFDRPPADLLLRGSAGQGVLGLRSDVDFELSAAHFPRGDTGAEHCVAAALGCFGLLAEGSAGRPQETDLASPDGCVTRDLHEWCELRRPSSPIHDAGWASAVLTPDPAEFLARPSMYEAQGRDLSAKYLWFEARAAVARLVFGYGGADRPPVRIPDQLNLLPALVPESAAAELTTLVRTTFDLRESADPEEPVLNELAQRLDRVRAALSLPGPVAHGTVHTQREDSP